MTVSSTSSRVVHIGNGVATSFPFAFKVKVAADLVVVYTDVAGGDFTLSPSQYGASGFGDDAGGTVTYPLSGSPIATGTKLTIYRDVAVTQPTQISNQGAMWPAVIEAALDRLTYIAQKVADTLSRALVVSPTDSGALNVLPNATQRASSLLGFDAAGQPYAAQLGAGLAAASSWLVANFFPAASAAAARTVLETPSNAEMAAADNLRVARATLTAKGSTYVASAASTPAELAVGADGTIPMARSAAALGVTHVAALAGRIHGLTWANSTGDATNDIDIAAGGCMDATGAYWIALAALTKRLDAAWASGTGQGGLDTGGVADTDYFVWAIARSDTGVTDVLFSASGSAPTMPASYDFKRLVGWFRRASGTIVAFKVYETAGGGVDFLWGSPPLDNSTALPDANRRLDTISVPAGIAVEATLNVEAETAGNLFARVWCPDQANEAPNQNSGAPLHNVWAISTEAFHAHQLKVRTNTSQQVACRGTAATTAWRIVTEGFRWSRQ